MKNEIQNVLRALTTQELWPLAMGWGPKEWLHQIGQLSPLQISSIMPAASEEYDPLAWKEKLSAAISGLTERTHLEAAGQALNIAQIVEILSYIPKDPSFIDRLAPIFVGMPHALFFALLTKTSPEQLILLKQEALTEAIQHHLMLAIQTLTENLKASQLTINEKEEELNSIAVEQIGSAEIKTISNWIESLYADEMQALNLINKALAVAWNTLRLDLIDQLSDLKELHQKIIIQNIGTARNASHAPTGLWLTFENRLNSIFTLDATDQQSLQDLPEDLPTQEALIKFGAWYLRDYWELGLLPSVKEEKELEMPLEATPAEIFGRREKLFLEVNNTLEKLHLAKLVDLKQAHIYSRKALQEYIQQNEGLCQKDKIKKSNR